MGPVTSHENGSPSDFLRIAFCLPKLEWLTQIGSNEPVNAACIQQWYIAEGLRARGHDLTLVAPRGPDIFHFREGEPRTAPVGWSGSHCFEFASKASWRVQQWLGIPYLNVFSNYRRFDACRRLLPGFDLAFERNGLYSIGVAKACRRLTLPYVLFFDADEIMERDFQGDPITGLLRWRARNLLAYNLRAADGVIAVSKPAKANLVDNWKVREEKIVVFPNAVDVRTFHPDPETGKRVRGSLEIADNPIVMFIGGFYEWHDVGTLLEAFAGLLKIRPDVRLVLVGEGSRRPDMMDHSSALGIGHAVRFTGRISHKEVPDLLCAADIAVAPYPRMDHGLWLSPMKLFEYMAAGKAVIASQIEQLAEVIEDGKSGILVPPGNALDLTAALGRLIDDENLRDRLGREARTAAIRKYSWEQYLLRLENFYAAVIAGRPFQHARFATPNS